MNKPSNPVRALAKAIKGHVSPRQSVTGAPTLEAKGLRSENRSPSATKEVCCPIQVVTTLLAKDRQIKPNKARPDRCMQRLV
jgi:hypothetical protein